MMKYLFDTSFLISLIFENDVLHNKACEILEKINKDYEFYINEIIYIEAITVSCYKWWVEKSFILKLFLEKIDCKFIGNNNLEYVDYFFFFGKNI